MRVVAIASLTSAFVEKIAVEAYCVSFANEACLTHFQYRFPSVRTSRLSDAACCSGIEGHEIDGVKVRVCYPEKTLVDCFSRRNDVGLDVAIEAIKSYVSRRKVNVDLIMEYATKLRVIKAIRPYLEALL